MIRLGNRVFRAIDRHAVWAHQPLARVRPCDYVWGDQSFEKPSGRDWRYDWAPICAQLAFDARSQC